MNENKNKQQFSTTYRIKRILQFYGLSKLKLEHFQQFIIMFGCVIFFMFLAFESLLLLLRLDFDLLFVVQRYEGEMEFRDPIQCLLLPILWFSDKSFPVQWLIEIFTLIEINGRSRTETVTRLHLMINCIDINWHHE